MVNTGDNLAHPKAVPAVVQALGDLLSVPGVFVFGSNDYFGPRPKNPANYLTNPSHRVHGEPLPWQDLRAAFTERGWLDMTHTRREFEVAGLRIAAAGVDDPHLQARPLRDHRRRGQPAANLTLGLTHSPEPRVLDRFAADGYQLVMAGHTHGGQLCLPFYGAIVTNCDLDRSRAKGASQWGANMQLHVSAGIGTSPFAPLRFCCRPEATLLTLVAAPTGVVTPAPGGAVPPDRIGTVSDARVERGSQPATRVGGQRGPADRGRRPTQRRHPPAALSAAGGVVRRRRRRSCTSRTRPRTSPAASSTGWRGRCSCTRCATAGSARTPPSSRRRRDRPRCPRRISRRCWVCRSSR